MSHKTKCSAEEKIRIVRAIIAGKISESEAARQKGVHKKSVRRWLAKYEAEGVDALIPADRNRTYSSEIKQEAVSAFLAGKRSLQDIFNEFKIRNTCQLSYWLKVYNAHGDFNSVKHSGGGSYMKQGRETTQEERIEIAKACIESGRNYGEAARKYRVSYQQARSWTLKYIELGEADLEDRRGKRKRNQTPRIELEAAQIEIEQLKRKLYLAEVERDLLKKLDEIERSDAFRK